MMVLNKASTKQRTVRSLHFSHGFTLIELLIAVVIVGILASIALPGYQQFVQNGRRSEGQAALLDIAGRQEQFFLDNHEYTANLTALGLNANPFVTEEGWYDISAACDAGGCSDGYTLTATPQAGQAADGNLTLNALGTKTGKW